MPFGIIPCEQTILNWKHCAKKVLKAASRVVVKVGTSTLTAESSEHGLVLKQTAAHATSGVSSHCIRAAQTLNRLHRDLGSQGFQAVGIVFGPDADVQRVNYLVEDFKLTFPAGYANLDKVDSYLARESNEILNIPQIVVIDRAGVIRAQSGKKGGSPTLENESSLRSLIDSLLKEEAPRNAKAPGVARKKGN